MTKQNITPNPEARLFEAYMSYAGGHNSEIANDRLRDDEFPVMDNVDLSGRDSAKRRTGRTKFTTLPLAGVCQGHFLFYRVGAVKPDHIFAANGRLYLGTSGVPTNIPITDGSTSGWTFQAVSMIEAVQYGTTLFIATGTKLVEVSCDTAGVFTAKTVVPYTPSVQEVIYIGTNALAPNPSSYVQDSVTSALSVSGISPYYRSGAVNMVLPFTAYIGKPATMASVDYKWEFRVAGTTAWTMGRDWTQDTAGGKTYNLNVASIGTYDIQLTVRDHAVTTTTTAGNIAGFRVEGTLNKENNTQDVSGIQTCRNIRLHWDRILLYGDVKNPFLMYISDLKNPRYIPTTNVLSFDTGKLEPVNSVIRFQDYLVVMTTTTIQTLIGKDPSTYGRFLIHDSIGCIAPRSASVVGNQIIFLSYNGLTSLRPNQYRIEAMNVKRTDVQIHNEIYAKTITNVTPDYGACAMFHDNQYWICFPLTKVIYRFYHELGVWVRDRSNKLNITQFTTYGGKAYNVTASSVVYIHDDNTWADDGDIYTMELDSKMYDLGYSFNFKKMRRMYVLARHFKTNTNLFVKVFADSAVVLTPEDGKAVVVGNGTDTIWQVTTEPNMHFYAGTQVGTWVLGKNPLGDIQISVQKASIQGKCRRVKVNIQHKENAPCELYGVGFEHKLKKV